MTLVSLILLQKGFVPKPENAPDEDSFIGTHNHRDSLHLSTNAEMPHSSEIKIH